MRRMLLVGVLIDFFFLLLENKSKGMFLEVSGAAQRAALKSRRPRRQLVKGRLHPLQDLAPLSATSSAPALPRGKIATKNKKEEEEKIYTSL